MELIPGIGKWPQIQENRRELNTIIVLRVCVWGGGGYKITSSLVLTLMPIDCIIFNPNQRSFSLQQMMIVAQSKLISKQRVRDGGVLNS